MDRFVWTTRYNLSIDEFVKKLNKKRKQTKPFQTFAQLPLLMETKNKYGEKKWH